jgi:hypothetical protein
MDMGISLLSEIKKQHRYASIVTVFHADFKPFLHPYCKNPYFYGECMKNPKRTATFAWIGAY